MTAPGLWTVGTLQRHRPRLAISPIEPDVLYAQIAAEGDSGGFFRSSNRGESWRKMSDYVCTDPQYYMELFPAGSPPFGRRFLDQILGVPTLQPCPARNVATEF